MITLYSGTPGSGKSYHAAKDIMFRINHSGGAVICNFPVNERIRDITILGHTFKREPKCEIIYRDNSELTVDFLKFYAYNYHSMGKEGQTLVVFDEAQIKFNSRGWDNRGRMKWIEFFSQHRKYGFNFILIAQNDRMLDRQIRVLIESEYKHRKLNNLASLGFFFCLLLNAGRPIFLAIEKWSGGSGVILSRSFIFYREKVSKLYDTYKLFDDIEKPKKLTEEKPQSVAVGAVAAVGGGGGTRSAGGAMPTAAAKGTAKAERRSMGFPTPEVSVYGSLPLSFVASAIEHFSGQRPSDLALENYLEEITDLGEV